ncbi:hypothetical protein [Robiginitalea sp. IMCC43444]|uniref:hypothetical protein n=1 Tax=Robiginitalea sp. IMCC43444 TaxID=3459121 RepID=UPI0040432D8D
MKDFFEELKKRNVYKVGTAYAVAAWLLLQVTDLVGSGLGWPESVTPLLIRILIVGFPIALILAWIYELTPQGFKKTGSSQAETPENKKVGRRLNQFIIGILALALCVMLVERVFFTGSEMAPGNSEASIAVLPFQNDSPDASNLYFCDGITEGVRENLSRIPGLSVISRTSVERFRENPPSVTEIAKTLGVDYILEGSVLRLEDRSIIRARLIFAPEDRHLWSEQYDRELKDIFTVLTEVTSNIANALQTTISPQLLEHIAEKPTEDLRAYDYYLQGMKYLTGDLGGSGREDLQEVDRLFQMALKRDSTFAQAYVGRAMVFQQQHQFEFFENKILLDSMLYLCNRAIALDPQLADAYWIRGKFYDDFMYEIPKARKDLERALQLNPNHVQTIGQLAWLKKVHSHDIVSALRLFKKLQKLDRSPDGQFGSYVSLSQTYWHLWDHEKSLGYLEQAMDLRPGVLEGLKAWYFLQLGRFEEAINLADKSWEQSAAGLAALGFFNLLLEDYEKALGYYQAWEQLVGGGGVQDGSELRDWHRYGQVLLALGRNEEGQKLMQQQLELNKKLSVNYKNAHGVLYESAGIYAMLGKKQQALETLYKFDSINRWDEGKLHFIQLDPMYDNIRGAEAFQGIINKRMAEIRAVRDEVTRLEAAGAL